MSLSREHGVDEGGDLIPGQSQVGQPSSIHGAQLADRLVAVPPAFQRIQRLVRR
jgi:hypothetical protein